MKFTHHLITCLLVCFFCSGPGANGAYATETIDVDDNTAVEVVQPAREPEKIEEGDDNILISNEALRNWKKRSKQV